MARRTPATHARRDVAHAPDGRGRRGREGERAAAALYERRGFAIVARNWTCPLGELDLVAARRDLLVFCEVKTRTGDAFGGGYTAVTWSKRRKLRQLAEAFLGTNGGRHARIRFDVASVWLGGDRADVEIFEDAF
jgi:putative endonuclease